jgi:hypothetical protein
MRDDMYKVIVERPRKKVWATPATARSYRSSEERPGKIGMREGYDRRKWLNENLKPLKRWLASQVNRPWDKVYAEICANIDRRNTVQDHIFAHLAQFVDIHTRLVDGKVQVLGWSGIPEGTLEEKGAELYVHPVTGILLRNRRYTSWARKHKRDLERNQAEIQSRRRKVSEMELLLCIEGIWYFVVLGKLAEPIPVVTDATAAVTRFRYPTHWDAVRKKEVSARHNYGAHDECTRLYGVCGVYAKSKRQLSASELRHYKLTNENAEETRRFSLCTVLKPRVSIRSLLPWPWPRSCCADP